jgi:hypothetical protein
MKTPVLFVILLLGLLAFAYFVLQSLINAPELIEPAKTKVVARSNLAALTLLTDSNVTTAPGTEKPPVNTIEMVKELENRYLLVDVKKDAEIKSEMAAPKEATEFLGSAVAVALPATAITTLGGQIKAGDMVELMAVQKKKEGESIAPTTPASKPQGDSTIQADSLIKLQANPKTHADLLTNPLVFEGMVLSLGARNGKSGEKDAEPGAVILAVPAKRRYEFAFAVADATLLVTHRAPQ